MEIKSIISKLHPLERVVLPVLKDNYKLEDITKAAKLKDVEAMRALQWLENKEVLKIHTKKKNMVSLDKNGLRYKKEGLPEKLFLSVLSEEFKGLNVITKKSKLSREEVNACLGLLKRKEAVEIEKGEFLQVKITEKGKELLSQKTQEEEFLENKFPLDVEKVKDKETFNDLKKRKDFLKVEETKIVSIELTKLGEELSSMDLRGEVVNRLTAEMLKTGEWKDKQFRAYDVEINVPRKHPGKKHFVNEAVDYIKKIWLEMGFKEMDGPMVESSFWVFDALFTPQDHPAREMQDTFFLNDDIKSNLPAKNIVEGVKAVHENGGNSGSKGWGYKWNETEAKKTVLRTHTTAITARTLAKLKKDDLPIKLFTVGKVFRNETLDWKHLFEFHQVEGIVADPNLNFKNLLGYLKEFFKKMGFAKARFRPAYFAYVEPGVEIDVFHPVKKEWVELGGAGLIRPEVAKPLLGFECPILAWGFGLERIISDYYKITDIRDLYKNDLEQLRKFKMWLK